MTNVILLNAIPALLIMAGLAFICWLPSQMPTGASAAEARTRRAGDRHRAGRAAHRPGAPQPGRYPA